MSKVSGKPFVFDEFECHFPGKGLGSGTDEHHMLDFQHDFGCQTNGIADMLQSCYGSGSKVSAIHNGSFEAVTSIVGKYGAFSGIEQRALLEFDDGGCDGFMGQSLGL